MAVSDRVNTNNISIEHAQALQNDVVKLTSIRAEKVIKKGFFGEGNV